MLLDSRVSIYICPCGMVFIIRVRLLKNAAAAAMNDRMLGPEVAPNRSVEPPNRSVEPEKMVKARTIPNA